MAEPIFICPMNGHTTTPVERRNECEISWWKCAEPCHVFHGKVESDWHIDPACIPVWRAKRETKA